MFPGREPGRGRYTGSFTHHGHFNLVSDFELRNLKPRNVQWLVGGNVKKGCTIHYLHIASNLKAPRELHVERDIDHLQLTTWDPLSSS